jgi:hypothetical protein
MKTKLKFDNTERGKQLSDELYMSNNGKKRGDKCLRLEKGDIYYTLLSKTPFTKVKFTNSIIDGSLEFDKEEFDNHIELSPSASYCIPVEDKYSFY